MSNEIGNIKPNDNNLKTSNEEEKKENARHVLQTGNKATEVKSVIPRERQICLCKKHKGNSWNENVFILLFLDKNC